MQAVNEVMAQAQRVADLMRHHTLHHGLCSLQDGGVAGVAGQQCGEALLETVPGRQVAQPVWRFSSVICVVEDTGSLSVLVRRILSRC